jgi:hypothetical protein
MDSLQIPILKVKAGLWRVTDLPSCTIVKLNQPQKNPCFFVIVFYIDFNTGVPRAILFGARGE